MKIKVFEAFAGYGSQAMALKRLAHDYADFDYEVVGISEIENTALIAYNAIHGHCPNFGDISKINWNDVPDFDLFTYSFPCQSVSNAGKQAGLTENSGTPSSLLWECRKAIQIKRPKYLLMENVPALVGKKFLPQLHKWQAELEVYGYTNFTKTLNAKDFGTPQNRNRVFMVSILGDANFEFPQPFELTCRLKDVLDAIVDEKYYISAEKVKAMLADCDYKFYRKLTTQTTTGNPQVIQVGNLYADTEKFKNRTMGRVYSTDGISPTINCCSGGDREPKILECDFFGFGRSRDKKGNVVSRHLNDYVNCIHAQVGSARDNMQVLVAQSIPFRIRKLTPKECFRLMDVTDEDIAKVQNTGISNSRQYKLAGNSICANVLYFTMEQMFGLKNITTTEQQQLTLF